MEQKKCTAIVLAAGQGKRMHSKIQKQFLEIGGKPDSVLFSEVFPAKLTDTGYYSGNRREYDFLLRKRNRGKVWI